MFLSCFLSACAASFQTALRGSCLLQQPHLAYSCWHRTAQGHSQSSDRVLLSKALVQCPALCSLAQAEMLHWLPKTQHCTSAQLGTRGWPEESSAPSLGGTRSSIPYSLGPFVKLLRNVLHFLQGFFKAVFFPRPKKLRITGSSNRFRKGKGKQQPRSTRSWLVSHYVRRQLKHSLFCLLKHTSSLSPAWIIQLFDTNPLQGLT